MVPYLFDIKTFMSILFLSIKGDKQIRARLGLKRVIFLLGFTPFYLSLQITNYVCFIIDEILFKSYRDIEVKKPFFIVGVPRSGTTFMHRMLCKDSQFTAIKSWEMIFAPSITQKLFWTTVGKLDALIGSPFKKLIIAVENAVASDFNKIHKVGLFETEEDEVMFLTSFTSCYLYFFFPDMRLMDDYVFFDENLSEERRKKIMGFRHTLIKKHMYVFGRDKTYMTKNPGDCPKVASIFEEFPDAKMAYLVRSPYECVPSVMNLFANMYKVANHEMEQDHIQELALMITKYWYQYTGDKVMEFPEDQRVVSMYSDLVSDPMGTAKEVYAALDYPLSDEFNQTLIEEAERASKYKSKHKYDATTHGLTVEDITREYADVFSRYGIPTAEELAAQEAEEPKETA